MALVKDPVIITIPGSPGRPYRAGSKDCPSPPPVVPPGGSTAPGSSSGTSGKHCYAVPVYGYFTPEQQAQNGGQTYGVVGYREVCD